MEINKLQELIKQTKNLTVLYVEDNAEVQTQTIKMLESFFNNIFVANNGKVGLELFLKNPSSYHLIITDIKMPILDGIGMIETIREIDKKIPILILSAHDDKDYFLKSINYGVDGYILKPYSLEQIAATLKNIIEKHNLNISFKEIIELEKDFIWNKKNSLLFRNNELIKLTKSETKLFQLFLYDEQSPVKTYAEIEMFVFHTITNNTKKIRNLMTRLRVKLGCDLFDTLHGYGHSLKYKKD